MTKKTTFLIMLIFIFFSVMVMAVFGAETGYVGNINVDKITFFNQEGNEVTEKVVDKDGNLSEYYLIKNKYDSNLEEYPYSFGVQLTPNNATDKRLSFTISKEDYANCKMGDIKSNLGEVTKTIEFENDPSSSVVKYTLNINITTDASSQSGDSKTGETPIFYYISFSFIEQEGVDFNFDFNLSGVYKKSNLRFAWEGTKHEQDIDI